MVQGPQQGLVTYLYAELSHPHDWAALLALLATSLGLAAVVVDDGDPRLGVALRRLLPLARLRRHPRCCTCASVTRRYLQSEHKVFIGRSV